MVLKSWDQDGARIIKVHCLEFQKNCGSDSGNHNNNVVANSFSNFKTSHLVSTKHIKNWCQKHIRFLNHPTFAIGKGKKIPSSLLQHKELIVEGVSILQELNLGLIVEVLHFLVVGNVQTPNLKILGLK